MTFTVYNKTQSVKGRRDGICRFLPSPVASLLLRFLTQVKGLEARFLAAQTTSADDCRTFLFTHDGKRMTDDHVCQVVADQMALHGLAIGFQDLRHSMIGLKRVDTEKNQVDEALYSALQCGHTLHTDYLHYAVSTQDSQGLAADRQFGFLQTSKRIHRLLGIE